MNRGDLREWLIRLESEGELRRIKTEVDWNLELGSVTAIARQKGLSGLLFENIKGYQNGHCNKVFTGSLINNRQISMMFGLPKDSHQKDLVDIFRKRFRNGIRPVTVNSGPVKENIVQGKDVNVLDFPVPRLNHRDGGRYIGTMAGIVTRDPDSGFHNLGLYRAMVLDKNKLGMFMNPMSHGGQHLSKYASKGKVMPIALVIGCGSQHGILRMRSNTQRHLRIRRHGQYQSAAGRIDPMRNVGTASPGLCRDRDRGHHVGRPGHFRNGGAVWGIYRILFVAQYKEASHQDRLRHVPQ